MTDRQKQMLRRLEPRLRNAARIGDLDTAKELALKLQNILRSTGHLMRLFQSKNWLFEAAMEAGEIKLAIRGFKGIRVSVRLSERVSIVQIIL